MSQPKWKRIENLGDADPLNHGGVFVEIDETGVYPPEMEQVDPPGDDQWSCDGYGPEARWEVHRFPLDRLKEVREENSLYLVPASYEPDWPRHVSVYEEWFVDSLPSVASSMDYPEDELRSDLQSEDPVKRACAYRAIADHHGWINFDGYPLKLTEGEAEKRIGP